MQLKSFWSVTIRAAQDWWEDNCLRLAASLAYYTALSLAPLVLLIVGIVGLVLDRQQVASQLEAQLESLMGPAGRELVTNILTTTSPQGGTWATVVGLITLIIGATAVFGELQTTMNLIWEVQPAPTSGAWAGIRAWLKERVFSLAIVFALAFLLLVSLVVSAALAGAAALFWGPEQTLLSRLLELAVSLVVLTLGFALLFTYMPDSEDCLHGCERFMGYISFPSLAHGAYNTPDTSVHAGGSHDAPPYSASHHARPRTPRGAACHGRAAGGDSLPDRLPGDGSPTRPPVGCAPGRAA